MRFEQTTITPAEAQAMLQRSEGTLQRTIAQGRVNEYAEAMKRGEWQLTHQGVAVTDAGRVIDGRHRLSAIVAANVPVQMVIAWDVPAEAFEVIDTGRARSTSDGLRIQGYTDPNSVASTLNFLASYDAVVGTPTTYQTARHSGLGKVTTTQAIKLLATERGALALAERHEGARIASGLSRRGARAWIASILVILREAGVDEVLYDEFTEKLTHGTLLPEGSPILAFRRWMLARDTGFDRLMPHERAWVGSGMLMTCWNHWMLGIVEHRVTGWINGRSTMPAPVIHRPLPGQTLDADGNVIEDTFEPVPA